MRQIKRSFVHSRSLAKHLWKYFSPWLRPWNINNVPANFVWKWLPCTINPSYETWINPAGVFRETFAAQLQRGSAPPVDPLWPRLGATPRASASSLHREETFALVLHGFSRSYYCVKSDLWQLYSRPCKSAARRRVHTHTKTHTPSLRSIDSILSAAFSLSGWSCCCVCR